MAFHRILAGLILALAASAAYAAPAQVIIIRHGEKPADGNELNERGFQRADALVGFFQHDPAVTKFGTPAGIYAMAPKGPDGSVRAIQTVTPLSTRLGVAIDKDFKKDQLSDLVKDIMGQSKFDGKMVLICWEHKVIPDLAMEFGENLAPKKWPGGDFYSVWILDFKGDKPSAFKRISENVLPGDPSNP